MLSECCGGLLDTMQERPWAQEDEKEPLAKMSRRGAASKMLESTQSQEESVFKHLANGSPS